MTDPQPGTSTVVPSPEHTALALAEVPVLMAPVVRWLLRHGVHYGALADVLKSVFLEVARDELRRSGGKATHSAISVLSGVHRKDVRALLEAHDARPPKGGVSLASQVFTRWITDPRFRQPDGAPAALPRTGAEPSFDALARAVSTDVHPRSMLDELLRLGLVLQEGDTVRLNAEAFVPAGHLQDLTALFTASAADHIAAAVHNLTEAGPKHLEQSVFADGLSQATVDALGQAAREAWAQIFDPFVGAARERLDADNAADLPPQARRRMRFGVYFYSEPMPAPAEPAPSPPEPESRAAASPPPRAGESSEDRA